ncbi:MAG: heparinase II/III family protein [Coprobacillaceae bacterium]
MYKNYKKQDIQEDLIDIKTMDLLLDNTFMYTRKFDMERCDVPYYNPDIDWDFVPNNDPEWAFVLNRMDYCIDLIITSIKTGKLEYALKAKEIIFKWIEENNYDNHHQMIRTLDTGIRITVWNECVNLLKQIDLINKEELAIIAESVTWQVKYIEENTQNFQQFSNWGMMQSIGFLNAELLSKFSTAFNYEKFYKQHLELQFFEDGMHHEQSSVYLMEVLIRLLQMRNPKYKTDKYYSLLKKAAFALLGHTNVNDKSIANGDGDEVDTIGILQMLAYETKDQTILPYIKGKKLREEAYWHYGDEIVDYLNKAMVDVESKTDFTNSFNYSGFEVVKKKDMYFTLSNGTMGGTHGHFDNLHINYSIHGTKIFSDMGRYTYLVGSKERIELKNQLGHNLIIPYDYTLKCKDVWKNSGTHRYSSIKKMEKNNFTFFKTHHTIENNKFATRVSLLLPDNSLIVADYYDSRYYVNFNFDYELDIDTNSLEVEGVGYFKPIYFDSWKTKKVNSSPIYNQLFQTTNLKVYPKDEVCINSFVSEGVEIKPFTDFEYLHYDRLFPYEKKYNMIEVKSKNYHYVIGLKFTDGANCDNCIKLGSEYIFGTMFVYDLENKQKIIFEQ